MGYQQVVKASEVIGVKVKNLMQEQLGQISDVVINKALGSVNYLVLDFGGFLGIGSKYFAVPWTAFNYNTTEDCFILNMDKERLSTAPGFDKDNWPNFSDAAWMHANDQYYR